MAERWTPEDEALFLRLTSQAAEQARQYYSRRQRQPPVPPEGADFSSGPEQPEKGEKPSRVSPEERSPHSPDREAPGQPQQAGKGPEPGTQADVPQGQPDRQPPFFQEQTAFGREGEGSSAASLRDFPSPREKEEGRNGHPSGERNRSPQRPPASGEGVPQPAGPEEAGGCSAPPATEHAPFPSRAAPTEGGGGRSRQGYGPGGKGGLLGSLSGRLEQMDQEALLIAAVLLLLYQKQADKKLIWALIYILIG